MRKLSRTLMTFGLITLLAIVTAGCSKKQPDPTPAPEPALAEETPADEVTAPQHPMDQDFTINAHWHDETLHITGTALVPDVVFIVYEDGKEVAYADAQVKEGRYEGNVTVENGPKRKLRLRATTPALDIVLAEIEIPVIPDGK